MTGRRARTRLLDEFSAVTGWERKHANKVLLGLKRKTGIRGRRGAPKQYDPATVEVLKKLLALDGPTMWEKNEGHATAVARISQIPGCDQRPLETISAATIDRLLGDFKIQSGKKARPPKPASGVKSLVEIRAENWDTAQPGWTEVDTVAHCGGDMGGSFIWTLTSVDVSSGWTELRAIWNRSQHACFEGTGIDPQKPALQAVGSGQRQRWRVPQLPRLQLAERSRHQAKPAPAPTSKTTRPMWSRRTTHTSADCSDTTDWSTRNYYQNSTNCSRSGACGRTSIASR